MKTILKNRFMPLVILFAMFFFVGLVLTSLVHAADAAPAVVPAAAANVPGFLDHLTSVIMSWGGLSVGLAVILEAVFRLSPTQSPLSWAHLAAATFHALSKLLDAAAAFLDKVLPQRLK